MLPLIAGMTAFSVDMVISQTFFPGWLQTTIFPISTFPVTRITGVNHQCPTGIGQVLK
jgi:hypothetical protein